MPSIAESLSQDFGANVEFHPVMLLDDLKKSTQNMQNSKEFVLLSILFLCARRKAYRYTRVIQLWL
jgi:hypothetical protein